jgi:hypothetical protein
MVLIEYLVVKKQYLLEMAIILAVAVFEISLYNIFILNEVLVYTNISAAALLILAYLRNRLDQETAKIILLFALSLFSVPLGYFALNDGGIYQEAFLISHAIILSVGVVLSNRPVTIRGAGGVILAAIYYLRNYTFILFGLIGLGLIALAVWQLLKKRPEQE